MLNKHILPAFGHMNPADVRKFHIEAHLGAMAAHGVGAGVLAKVRMLERSIFDDLEENDFVGRNPAKRAELPAAPASKRSQPYGLDEIRKMCLLPGVDGLMLRVMALCGLRPGELLALRCDDLKDGLLVVDESTDALGHYKATKTGRARAVSLPPGLRSELEALASGLPGKALLFDAVGTVYGLLLRLRRAVGDMVADFNLRRLRTSTANHAPLSEVDRRDLLGHMDVEMTRGHYLVADRERQAAALAELERKILGEVPKSCTNELGVN